MSQSRRLIYQMGPQRFAKYLCELGNEIDRLKAREKKAMDALEDTIMLLPEVEPVGMEPFIHSLAARIQAFLSEQEPKSDAPKDSQADVDAMHKAFHEDWDKRIEGDFTCYDHEVFCRGWKARGEKS